MPRSPLPLILNGATEVEGSAGVRRPSTRSLLRISRSGSPCVASRFWTGT